MNCSTGTVTGDSCLGREWGNLPRHDRIHLLWPPLRFSRGCATRVERAPSCTAATAPNGYVSHRPSALTGSAPRCRSAAGCRLRRARVPRFCVRGSSTNPSARRCCRTRGLPSAVWSRCDDAVGPIRSDSAKLASRRCPPPSETGLAMLLRRCPSPVRSSGLAVHPEPGIPRSSSTARGASAKPWRHSSLRQMAADSKVRPPYRRDSWRPGSRDTSLGPSKEAL